MLGVERLTDHGRRDSVVQSTPSRWASQAGSRPGFPAIAPGDRRYYPRLVVSAAASAPARRPRGIASFPPSIAQNPYQRLLYDHVSKQGVELVDHAEFKLPWLWRNRGEVRLLHFHWPQSYYLWLWGPVWARTPLSWLRLILFRVRLASARLLGYRILWTVHQVYPHETVSRWIDRLAGRALARACHRLIAHDRTTAERIERELGVEATRVTILAHGSYGGVYRPGRERQAMRVALDLAPDLFVFLSFGHVRQYKDLDFLLSAFREVEHPGVALLVAGLPLDEASVESVRRAAARDPRVRLLLEFVPEEGVAELFAACDAAVVARSDGGTSGALVLALSLGLPVVAVNAPTYADLLGGGKAGWLFDSGSQPSLAATLAEAASDPEGAVRRASEARAVAQGLRWEEHGELIANLVLDGALEPNLSYA